MKTIDKLAVAVHGRVVSPPSPDWFKASIPDREEVLQLASRDQSSSFAAYIGYTAESGKRSERRIICRKVEGYGKAETIGAWCCETKAHKRFRIDRISDLICLKTGEVLDPSQHFEMLRLHGSVGINDKALTDLCRILVFMAKCDGDVHPLEEKVIATAVERYVLRFGGDDRLVVTTLKNSAKIAPDHVDFVDSLAAIERHPNSRSVASLLIEHIGEVAVADGQLHANELEWSGLAIAALKAIGGTAPR
jgi:Predicted transcriptional regulator